MSDEIAENGTANGDVPEIELIIKVVFISIVYCARKVVYIAVNRVVCSLCNKMI